MSSISLFIADGVGRKRATAVAKEDVPFAEESTVGIQSHASKGVFGEQMVGKVVVHLGIDPDKQSGGMLCREGKLLTDIQRQKKLQHFVLSNKMSWRSLREQEPLVLSGSCGLFGLFPQAVKLRI